MDCPSCGAKVPFDQRLAVISVCPFCASSLIWSEDLVRATGKMSALAAPLGQLSIGARGRLPTGQDFLVLGRVRYGYGSGCWDEWYLQHPDLRTSWLSEDERRLVHESLVDPSALSSAPQSLARGDRLQISGEHYTVMETGAATCEGGQGQLPFPIQPGQQVTYLDLAGRDNARATIEIEACGQLRVFCGQLVEAGALVLTQAPQSGQELSSTQAQGSRPRLSYEGQDGQSAHAIRCPRCGGHNPGLDIEHASASCVHCGASLKSAHSGLDCESCGASMSCASPEAKLLACRYCGASHELREGKPTLLAMLQEHHRIRREEFRLPLALGDKAKLEELEYELVGYLRFKEFDGSLYITDEYLLYAPDWGYRWLCSYDGHWILQEKLTQTPEISLAQLEQLRYRSRFWALGRSWRCFETGQGRLDWVEGELPWVAKRMDRVRYIEAIALPQLLSCEITDDELSWTLYRYLELEDLAAAFGKAASDFPKPKGVYACQPDPKRPYHLTAALMCFAAMGLAFILSIRPHGQAGDGSSYLLLTFVTMILGLFQLIAGVYMETLRWAHVEDSSDGFGDDDDDDRYESYFEDDD